MEAFAIRLYGKRWLQTTRRPDQDDARNGWRALTWTDDIGSADKWASRDAAENFLKSLPCRGEVREIQPQVAPTPTGGRVRLAMYGSTQAVAA